MFQHFIITHFNLRNFSPVDTTYEDWCQWTMRRIGIFKKYCLPSLLNQDNQNFTWLLYIDETTPQELRDKLPAVDENGNIHYIYVDGFPRFMAQYTEDVKRMCPPGTEWVITSRLDNDDCLHREAVNRIQKNFIPAEKHMISLASGYVYDQGTGMLSHYYYPNSPFISLIEKTDKDMSGIYFFRHSEWACLKFSLWKELLHKVKNATFVVHDVLWMQVVHNENVSNDFYRGVPVLVGRDLSAFGLAVKSKPTPFWKVVCYKNIVFWKRYAKISFYRMLVHKHTR